MSRAIIRTGRAMFVVLAALLIVHPASADDRRGRDDRDDRREHGDRRDDRRGDRDHRSHPGHFDDHRRVVVREYYVKEYQHARRCPPGFVRHERECKPPQHARQWERGRPLPREVVYYSVPPKLVVELGAPPAGHKYVRVASDILLIAIGTGLVVDAIHDLGRQ